VAVKSGVCPLLPLYAPELTSCRRLCPIFVSGGSEGPPLPDNSPAPIIPTLATPPSATTVGTATSPASQAGPASSAAPPQLLPRVVLSKALDRLSSELPPARPPRLRLKRPVS